MDGQTTNDELDFGASDSTTEQTLETSDSPETSTNEQTEVSENTEQSETADGAEQVETQVDDAQVTDEVLAHFLESKGIKSDESEMTKETLYKLGKMAYNSERQYKRGTQEIAELKRQLSASQQTLPAIESQPTGEESQPLNYGQASNDFIREVEAWEKEKGLTQEEAKKMIDWLSVQIGKNEMNGQPIIRMHLLANHSLTFEDVYHAAGCGSTKANALKEQMMGEVKKEMAARQSAKRPVASATNSAQFGNKESDPFLEGLLGE